MPASRRAAIPVAAAAVAVALAACTAPASSVNVRGNNLTIYIGAPATGDPHLRSDVLDAEQLALSQIGDHVNKFTVRQVVLTDRKISNNARTAIQDKTAIAYLGEIVPGDSADSIGINNAQDLLQVTPTDTAVEETQSTPAVSGSPNVYYESLSNYGRTFARVVPTSALEAKAQVEEMQSLGVHKVYVTDDGEPYGSAIAQAVKQNAGSTISVTQGPADASHFASSGADAMFIGANDSSLAAQLARSVTTSNPKTKVFVPSALDTASFADELAPGAVSLYASSPGFLDRDLTTTGKTFVTDFTNTYHHAPATQAIFGYEAMASVLSVLREAGSSANNRSTIVHDFFALKNRSSVLGSYSINASGDTNLAPFVFSRVRGGALVPYKFMQVQG
jgi:branched-chain amino acid transport system substrate-binding protein